MNKNLGLIYALMAYLWWGVIPIFWKQLDHIPSMEIVAHRMVWSCLIVLILIIAMRQWREFSTLFRQPATILRLCAASAFVMINWAIFIWAVNNNHIVETSLGYFINPLITVFFGRLFFGETLTKGQTFALILAVVGVAVMVVSVGRVPIISLSLAVTFALYSVMKKSLSVPATHGLGIETLMVLVPAAAYLMIIDAQGSGNFGISLFDSVMLILGGLFTLIPLLLFAAAAKKISLTALGMTQYLGPSCQLFIGVVIYHEPFGHARMLAFGIIWLALVVYSIDQLKQQRIRRMQRPLPQ